LNPDAKPPTEGAASGVADHAAERIVDGFLFKGEAGQRTGWRRGDDEFQRSVHLKSRGRRTRFFGRRIPFKQGRLFHCSYMVYSAAFQTTARRREKQNDPQAAANLRSHTAEYPDISSTERRKSPPFSRRQEFGKRVVR
jgi:hypothetical protein